MEGRRPCALPGWEETGVGTWCETKASWEETEQAGKEGKWEGQGVGTLLLILRAKSLSPEKMLQNLIVFWGILYFPVKSGCFQGKGRQSNSVGAQEKGIRRHER